MPFLIIIAVGVIIVLLFNLFSALFVSQTSGDAFLHLESGSVQMKMFGTDDYFDLTSDALVMQGDELITSANSKVIIEFFDGTLVRLDGSTDVILEEIGDGDEPHINMMLVDGKLWFNKVYKNTSGTSIEVQMSNVVVKSIEGGIFTIENEFDEAVRVINGDDVMVDVMDKDGEKVVESEKVGVGQEIVFSDAVLQKYWQFQSPSVLSALSDGFKETGWYSWNIGEDIEPTEFSKAAILGEDSDLVEVAPEVYEPEAEVESEVGEVVEEEAVVEEEPVEESVEEELVEEEPSESVDFGALTTPTITSVSGVTETNADGFYIVTKNPGTLVGGISGAEDVVVSGYTLQKFVAGDGTWTYYANADYALMEVGENSYEVYAVAPDGTKSESITVKVLYQPPAPVVEEVVEEVPPVEPVEEPV
ncbi:MAG: hypothetical protein GWP15_02855 [Nitrospirae bacterium]|nr:hypothetical protein [Nitrospirota bacterium]